jgi:hypothetical protein
VAGTAEYVLAVMDIKDRKTGFQILVISGGEVDADVPLRPQGRGGEGEGLYHPTPDGHLFGRLLGGEPGGFPHYQSQ